MLIGNNPAVNQAIFNLVVKLSANVELFRIFFEFHVKQQLQNHIGHILHCNDSTKGEEA